MLTLWRIAPVESSLSSVLLPASATQMFVPSKRTPNGEINVPAAAVTFQVPGVTIETVPPEEFAVQIEVPSKAMPSVPFPRLLVTVVTAPGTAVGSIM